MYGFTQHVHVVRYRILRCTLRSSHGSLSGQANFRRFLRAARAGIQILENPRLPQLKNRKRNPIRSFVSCLDPTVVKYIVLRNRYAHALYRTYYTNRTPRGRSVAASRGDRVRVRVYVGEATMRTHHTIASALAQREESGHPPRTRETKTPSSNVTPHHAAFHRQESTDMCLGRLFIYVRLRWTCAPWPLGGNTWQFHRQESIRDQGKDVGSDETTSGGCTGACN